MAQADACDSGQSLEPAQYGHADMTLQKNLAKAPQPVGWVEHLRNPSPCPCNAATI